MKKIMKFNCPLFGDQTRYWNPLLIKKIQFKIECDEMWLFVKSKKNKQKIWIAINNENGEIIGFISERDLQN